ncbi:MAG: AI-2E family transporter [Bdellovibrionales bacterium]
MVTVSQNALRRSNRWKLIGLLALLSSLFLILLTVENLLVSSLLAFVISYTLGPVVNHLERLAISRTLATVVVYVVAGVLLTLVGLWLFPYIGETLARLQADMPRIITGVGEFISEVEARLHTMVGPLSSVELTSGVETQLTAWTQQFFGELPGFVKTFLTVMLLGPFLSFFMVKDGRTVSRAVMGLVPNHLFETALNLLHQINVQIGQFVRARILESVIVGLVTALGLFLIAFPYAILLGLVAGATNLIPYLGPLLGAVPAFLIAMVNGYSGLTVALLAAVYIVAQLIDAGILIPMLVAKIVDLHPVTVIVVIIAGAQVMGVLGMIISIPVASTIKVTVGTIYRHLTDTRV